MGVIAKLLTVLRAPPTDFGTDPAGPRVQIGSSQHKVRARLADLGTIQQEPDVIGLRVTAALLQAVRDRLQTNAMAVQTLFDALLHLLIHNASNRYERKAHFGLALPGNVRAHRDGPIAMKGMAFQLGDRRLGT